MSVCTMVHAWCVKSYKPTSSKCSACSAPAGAVPGISAENEGWHWLNWDPNRHGFQLNPTCAHFEHPHEASCSIAMCFQWELKASFQLPLQLIPAVVDQDGAKLLGRRCVPVWQLGKAEPIGTLVFRKNKCWFIHVLHFISLTFKANF